MARPLRIEFRGALYHVTARGDRREDIFLNDADREAWLTLLAQVCQRFNWVCHAYCQMNNHYHLLIETPEGNLAAGMRQLNGVYTQYINREHQRVGHVFQGRYKAILVEKESHLLELARYVVLNPVRAGLVRKPDAWAWSSYAATAGKAPRPAWLHTDWLLSCFDAQRHRAMKKYVEFVRAGAGLPSVWEGLRQQIFLGSERFVARMQKHIGDADLSEVPRAQRKPPAKPLEYYRKRYADRRQGMAQAYLSGAYTMKAIGQYFGVHYATVSRALRAVEGDGEMYERSGRPSGCPRRSPTDPDVRD